MSEGFAIDWLAARAPYDVAALDRTGIDLLRAWLAEQPADRPLRVVDLGCGTGSGLRRTLTWLGERAVVAYGVDRDPTLLEQFAALGTEERDGDGADASRTGRQSSAGGRVRLVPLRTDVLGPLDGAGGPADGTVDLLVSHAVADLFPLDRFAARIAALVRPGGRAWLALTYDGETRFSVGAEEDAHDDADPADLADPADPAELECRVMAAYHRHMDRARAHDPTYGGSTAGRRLAAALQSAGLVVVRAAPSSWDVRAGDGAGGAALLARLLDYVVRAVSELGEPSAEELARWERSRRAALDAGTLRARVRHLDVIAAR